MWLLPQPFSIENIRRIDIFKDIVIKNPVDFICLQEVWLNSYYNYFRSKFKDYYFVGKNDFLYNKTGLIILSKYKPITFEKHCFKFTLKSTFYDSLGRKGWLMGRFIVNNVEIDILNVQLDSPLKKWGQKSWDKQYSLIKNIIKNNENILIAAGDFNGDCNDLLQKSTRIFEDDNKSVSYSQKNMYTRKGFHKITWKLSNYDKDLDYVMLFTKKKVKSMKKMFISKPLVSDHYPILVNINI
jgi:endonuclease/exonuclease/phosphatase family metal-dependent hydrolase